MERTIGRIAELNAEIKAMQAEVEDLYSTLPQSSVPGKYNAGDYILTVTPTRRFDAKQAEKVLSVAKYKKILVPKVDSAQAKKVLTGDEYTACQAVTGNRRTISKVEEDE